MMYRTPLNLCFFAALSTVFAVLSLLILLSCGKNKPRAEILQVAVSPSGNQVFVEGTTGNTPKDSPSKAIEKVGESLDEGERIPTDFFSKLLSLTWVACSPTHLDPEKRIFPPEESLKEDLKTLHDAGFNGLVTYSAEIFPPQLVKEAGFKGLILGIWNPLSSEELQKAKAVARSDILIGYAVGNEGLDVRYDFSQLRQVMDELKKETGKPVTTTEEFGDYYDERLLSLGDFLFPNVHPYWHGVRNPEEAVQWTLERFQDLTERAKNRVVLFKEVGLPSGGDAAVSEHKQAEYYRLLKTTSVKFVWFEGFDQTWKDHQPVEPYWGLFRSDRTPKEVVKYIK